MEYMEQLITAILSSAGLTGSVFGIIVTIAIRHAKKDAETKRKERIRLEINRLEGEEKLSLLLFSLIRYSKGLGTKSELESAENAYKEYLETSNKLKNQIIGNYAWE